MCSYFKFPFFFLAVSFVLLQHGFSQGQDNYQIAKQLKSEYAEHECAALSGSTEIEFILDKKNSRPLLLKRERFKLITLKDYAKLVFHAPYDDNSEVDPKYIAHDNKNRTLYGVQSVCGNYEMKDVFYSDAKVCSYSVPLGEFASINHFGVNTKYTDVKYFTKLFFHDHFPMEESTISFTIPEWMEVQLMEMNFEGYDIEKSISANPKSKSKTHLYKLKKVKAFDKEGHTKGICHRYPHILVISKSFTVNGQKEKLLGSAEDLYSMFHEMVKTVENHPEAFKEKVEALTEGKKTPEEKIKAIYYWVQDNIRYIAFEDGIAAYKPMAADKVFNNRYGDCKGMANLAKEMLKLAGFDARLTWIGTNNLPYSSGIPSLAIYDHMICTVFVGNEKYIIDPTEKFVALGDYAERIQGKEIMIENGTSFIKDKVPVLNKDRNLTTIVTNMTLDGSTMAGNAEMIFRGESKKGLLYEADMINSQDKEKLFKYLTTQGGNKNLSVSEIKTSTLTEREEDLKINYSFKMDNYVSTFGNELYIDIDPFKQCNKLKLDSTRQYDYDFGSKIYYKDSYRLKIPSGYRVKFLPAGFEGKYEEFSVKIAYSNNGEEIIMNKEIIFENGIISKSHFSDWNEVYKKLIRSYNDQIVLVKNQ